MNGYVTGFPNRFTKLGRKLALCYRIQRVENDIYNDNTVCVVRPLLLSGCRVFQNLILARRKSLAVYVTSVPAMPRFDVAN